MKSCMCTRRPASGSHASFYSNRMNARVVFRTQRVMEWSRSLGSLRKLVPTSLWNNTEPVCETGHTSWILNEHSTCIIKSVITDARDRRGPIRALDGSSDGTYLAIFFTWKPPWETRWHDWQNDSLWESNIRLVLQFGYTWQADMTDKWIYFRTWYTMDFVTPDIRADLVQHIKSLAKFLPTSKK